MSHIIIVDDDPLVGELVRAVLSVEGHVVGYVENSAYALEAIATKRPALVILDCNMPIAPGLAILREMRAHAALNAIPVLVLTARRGRQDVDVAFYHGADGYLKKPFDPDELAFRVEEMLAGGRRSVRALG